MTIRPCTIVGALGWTLLLGGVYALVLTLTAPTPLVPPPALLPPHMEALTQSYGDSPAVSLLRVHDADTLVVDVPGWPPVVGRSIGVRLYGWDAAELGTAHGDAAKATVEKMLQGEHKIVLKHLRRDKYFRLLAAIEVDGEDLGLKLSKAGLVREYRGEGSKPWNKDGN